MYAITGITGRVGGQVAEKLLAAGCNVRAVLRDESKAAIWASRGCDIAVAHLGDAAALASAFAGAEGVFILPPPVFDPEPGYPAAHEVAVALAQALTNTHLARVVSLSTIGADAREDNLLTQHTIIERALCATGLPVTFLRPAWFMENAAWDVASARDAGVLHSFLQPADRAIPMVATEDIAACVASLIREDRRDTRIVELEGPARVSPDDLADAFAKVLGRAVRVESVPRGDWEGIFRAQGMKHPLPRIRMLDGFNEGWIEFQDHGRTALKGSTDLARVIAALVADAEKRDAA